jgi:hypothetical protein
MDVMSRGSVHYCCYVHSTGVNVTALRFEFIVINKDEQSIANSFVSSIPLQTDASAAAAAAVLCCRKLLLLLRCWRQQGR